MDKATACQHALSLLGEINYNQHAAPAAACNLHYPDVLRYANNATHWSFARARRTLTPLAKPAADGIRTYLIPADCLRIISLRDPATHTRIYKWEKYADRIEIYSPATDAVELLYTADLIATGSELPDSAPDFCQYVIHLLAARIAPTITGQIELANMFEQKAAALLARAVYSDSCQTDSNDQAPPLLTSDILTYHSDTQTTYNGYF